MSRLSRPLVPMSAAALAPGPAAAQAEAPRNDRRDLWQRAVRTILDGRVVGGADRMEIPLRCARAARRTVAQRRKSP
jgi:hypothetical protein